MRLSPLGTISILFATTLAAQTTARPPADGTVLRREVYALPGFGELTEGQRTELTRYSEESEYEATRADRGFTLSKLRYASDGLRVVAYLYAPSATKSRRPVVIYNRGSYVAGDLAPALAPRTRRSGGACRFGPRRRSARSPTWRR